MRRSLKSEIDLLWSILPHPPGSVVRCFSRGGDARDGDFARNPRELVAFARAYVDRNVYVAPNPTGSTLGARHTAAEVTHWSYFLIDMDPIEEEHSPYNALGGALALFGSWGGQDFFKHPPIIIDSGRGVQAWIRLDDVPMLLPGFMFAGDIVTEESKRIPGVCTAVGTVASVARRVNGYWLKRLDEALGVTYGCRIDTSVSDLPRVMRCPGTINRKTGRMAYLVEPSVHVYKGLATKLIEGTPKTALIDPETPRGLARGLPWQDVYPHLTRTAQVYLTFGQAEPGRHKVMWHTAKKLNELGVSREEARKALSHANKLRGKGEQLEPEQVEHALNTAYGA